MGGKQLGFGDYEQSTAKKQTKRETFLAEMDKVGPWQPLIDLIEPVYPKTGSRGGHLPYALETMLRIHLMQHWYALSDPAMEDALIEVPMMRRFAGIDLMSEKIPDETTIVAFRHLSEKHHLGEKIFETMKDHIKAHGMSMKQGTSIDVTLIAAPSSMKTKQGERDPEMHQTKKGNQWNHRCADGFAYRMKVHNRCAQAKGYGIDVESDLIHSVQTTAANVHDLTPAAELLLGEQTVVCADAGYQGIANRPEMADKEIKFRVAMGLGNRRVLPETPNGRLLVQIETANAHIRSKGEYPFRFSKQRFGFHETRLRGMANNHCKETMLVALTNLFMARRMMYGPI